MMLLYSNLMKLVKDSNSFYYKDEFMLGRTFRIFNYRYCSYADWLKDGALEARGIMFEMDGGEPVRIASRPMEKFFNLNENPMTQCIEPSDVERVMTKLDGSLISTYVVDNVLFTKTKGTLSSDQALWARNLAYSMGYKFVSELLELDRMEYTVNMEYVAPNNRIVVKYQEEKLVVLNVRHKYTGKYMPISQIKTFPKVWENFVEGFCTKKFDLDTAFYTKQHIVREMENIEGFIWVLKSGQMVKVKTDWYVQKHKVKDGALNFRYCLEAVLEEKADDMRAALSDDPTALELLSRVESVVTKELSWALKEVEKFHAENKHETRKDYAIKSQGSMGRLFPLTMEAYVGKPLSLKDYANKQYDRFKEECNAKDFDGLREA